MQSLEEKLAETQAHVRDLAHQLEQAHMDLAAAYNGNAELIRRNHDLYQQLHTLKASVGGS
jgi:hypothetical protein